MFEFKIFVFLFFSFFGAFFATKELRKYALRHHLLDYPNDRSSHVVPTPRGGGPSIIVVFLLSLMLITILDLISWSTFLSLALGTILIAGIGWLDDHGHVQRKIRLSLHFFSAGLALWFLGSPPSIDIGSFSWEWGWFGTIIVVTTIAWLVNLYNFMDGIDGITAVETIFIAGVSGVFLYFSGSVGLAILYFSIVFASAGFLVFNWPPASIFMGDAGSGFLGFTLGVLAIAGAQEGRIPLWTSLILLGVFAVDATLTLILRIVKGGGVWYEGHRSHAYQHAAQILNSHLKVIVGISVINLLWLAPMAWASWIWPGLGVYFLVVAYLPLVILAWRFGAGSDTTPSSSNFFKTPYSKNY